mgnify:CR=1 FL=1
MMKMITELMTQIINHNMKYEEGQYRDGTVIMVTVRNRDDIIDQFNVTVPRMEAYRKSGDRSKYTNEAKYNDFIDQYQKDKVLREQMSRDTHDAEKQASILLKEKELQDRSKSVMTPEMVAIFEVVIKSNEKIVNQYREGNEKVINSLVGRVIKQGVKIDPMMILICLKEMIK